MIELRKSTSDRLSHLRAHASRDAPGIEIGPYFSPICPKSEGYDVLVTDVFSTEQLREMAAEDASPYVRSKAGKIEEVDFICGHSLYEAVSDYCRNTPQALGACDGAFSYIVSSHNFEHLPDPIRFLKDASRLLAEGGSLSMAIPTGTRCFDLARPLTTAGQLIDAHNREVSQPSVGMCFDSYFDALVLQGGAALTDASANFQEVVPRLRLDGIANLSPKLFSSFAHNVTNQSVSAHCGVFNPYSFCAVFADLVSCGFVPHLQIMDLVENGSEFIAHIRKSVPAEPFGPLSLAERHKLRMKALDYYFSDLEVARGRGNGCSSERESSTPRSGGRHGLLSALRQALSRCRLPKHN